MKKMRMPRAKVLSITDGDTFKVRLRGNVRNIRIACIDTPEMSEFGGKEARDALTGMLEFGSKVRLREYSYDLYGRLVAEVYMEEGKNVGLELVRQGFAEVYDLYSSQCNEDKLIKFEQRARRRRRGIWGKDNVETLIPGATIGTGTPGGEEPVSTEPESEIPLFTGSNRVTCSELPSQSVAKQWVDQGHTYLDNDRDGIPCESLPL